MIGMIPPVGTPFGWKFIFRPSSDCSTDFRQALADLLGGNVYFTGSGKGALYLILKAMHECRPDRDEVILPDYTCWTVPSAIVRAGLKVRPADVDPATLGILPSDLTSAITNKTLAVVAAHHFGLPSDMEAIEKLRREKDIFLIDDAAQGLGATICNRPLGSLGDTGVLSFGRGKVITTLAGGAAIVRNERIKAIADNIYHDEFRSNAGDGVADILQLAAYKLLFHPWLYWLPNSLPFLKLGETMYNPDFELAGLSESRQRRGGWMMTQMGNIIAARTIVADAYRRELTGVTGITLPVLPNQATACYLRFPLLVKDPLIRTEILRHGGRFGISRMYPDVISSIPDLKPHLVSGLSPCLNGAMVANSLITLPTHHGIKPSDIKTIAGFIREIVSR